MQKKTKVLTAVLLCTALVVAFTACAGCTTSTDPVVGTWVLDTVGADDKDVLVFYANETFDIYSVASDGYVTKTTGVWKKTADRRYESGLVLFLLSNDGFTLTYEDTAGNTVDMNKYSTYIVPTVSPTRVATPTPTATPTLAPTQIPKTKYEDYALQYALKYLQSTPYSLEGLIAKLKSDGFGTQEITYAINNCGANWYYQAIKCAESWSGLSRDELIDELEYLGFTHQQAEYAADKTGY